MFLEQPLLVAQSRFINSILLSAITLLLVALMRGQNSLRKIQNEILGVPVEKLMLNTETSTYVRAWQTGGVQHRFALPLR